MLGDLIYEGKGEITNTRVLDTEGPKIEASNSGTGKFNGEVEVREMWTEIGVRRPSNMIYGQAQGVFMTKDNNETATAIAYGVSPITSSEEKRYVSALYFMTSSVGRLAFLNNLIGVNEYLVDASQKYYHKVWQWK